MRINILSLILVIFISVAWAAVEQSFVGSDFLRLGPITSTIVPDPQSIKYTGEVFGIDRGNFVFNSTGVQHEIVDNAFVRYYHIIFRSFALNAMSTTRRNMLMEENLKSFSQFITMCNVRVISSNFDLDENMDESYILDTTNAPTAYIQANTIWGALRALESFSQLVKNGYALTAASMSDFPRFKYRGFMIDTARHFYPLNVIFQHIDAMSYAKLNVLHWHLVDDTSFPFKSEAFPELSRDGAFSPYHVYTIQDVKKVIGYAKERGIRVIPEFDTPGHVTAGYRALKPAILTECFNYKYKTGPLNPTIDATFEFVDKLYDEIKSVFEDKFVHIGGDEVVQTCWKSNPDVAKWVEERGWTYNQLEQYYIGKLLAMLKTKKLSYMVWQEVFTRDGKNIAPDTLVEVWDKDNWQTVVADVVASGFRTVLSAPYYLNLISYGQDWRDYYAIDPAGFEGGDAAESKGLLAGIEACMWSEYVDATNFIARTWPRTVVVAERGWSPKSSNNFETAQVRFQEYRCKLMKRGIDAQPIDNGANITIQPVVPHACEEEWDVKYNVPWL